MADEYKWGAVMRLPDGHRLFQLYAESMNPRWVAIADDSGREPQDCDDGVLWLDTDRPLMVAWTDGAARESFTIPLKNEQQEESRTITNAATLLHLSATFNWPITDLSNDNNVYRVTHA